jgi:crotonobetainyl-CoA:carnitine CoA-transferase CaiB-like acyl-CoA transferase
VQAYDGLLSGIRVLDLSIWRPGPYATQLLANLGADVLKVEPPGGDPMRVFPELFSRLNANKRSAVLDLKQPAERDRAYELVADADALVEGFRPGVAARLGLGEAKVREVNPDIVYCSVSGFGQDGPLALRPGHDINYQAYAGVLAPNGGPPVESALPIADLAGGTFAALAVCAALVGRARTGEGEHVDVAMADVLATWTGPLATTAVAGSDRPLGGLPTYGSFLTADDRWITLGVLSEQHLWTAVCGVLGLEDLADLDMLERVERHDEVRARLVHAIREWPEERLLDAFGAGAPVAPVLSREEMLDAAQFRARGLIEGIARDGLPVMGYPVRFETRRARPSGQAPAAGDHQAEGFLPRPASRGKDPPR